MDHGGFPKRWLLVLIALAICAFSAATAGLAQEIKPTAATENPAFEDYQQNQAVWGQSTARNLLLTPGLVPEPLNLSHLKGARFPVVGVAAVPPASYDLRTLSKLTPIRNQGSCGSCWDFASFGSLESSLMPAESFDGSENNLKNLAGFDFGCCSGGNRTMSTAYLARWGGAVAEADDPYSAGSCVSAVKAPKKHVQDVIFVPTRTGPLDNDAIKQAVMAYGAVYTTYYHSDAYYKSSTYGYYCPSSTSANHAVCVVGWDDNYPKTNFNTAAPGNGAWIIRNSWGTYWGQSGYFYMSYYDAVMGKSENAVFRAESGTNYDTIYQYDTLGWIGSTGYGSTTAWFANVFTATSTSPIAAASWYAAAPGAAYTLYVYKNPTSGPVTGGVLAATKAGTMDTAGYHTVRLDSSVPVTVGQKFSVVVKITTPGYGYPIPLERPYAGYSSKATASTGQSYMSSTGSTWSDVASSYANANVCLKAFGGGSSAPGPGVLSVTPTAGLAATGIVGGPFTPASQTYTLSNTGQTSLNWTASDTQLWTDLSATSGTLAAGATATVTVSFNSNANSLAAGSYSDTVTFANTTSGNGNATRSLGLTVLTPGSISVTPAAGLASSGPVGGPFGPAGQAYTLSNPGGSSVNWTASKTQSWVGLSATSGTLAPGATATVSVSIGYSATSLAVGSYSDTVTFANTTNGVGNATRSVSLTVSADAPGPGVLSVSPSGGLSATGVIGGPFSPSSQTYALTNSGQSSIAWTASNGQPWASLSATSGMLAPGATATVTVSINAAASNLAVGTYTDLVAFANTTNGAGDTTRGVSLTVNSAPSGYRIVSTTFGWIDPTYHTRVTLGDNSVSYGVYLPFQFKFYGKPYSYLYIGSNGLLGFSSAGLYLNYNANLPATTFPNAAIYPYWDDLNPAAGGSVRVGYSGAAPNRKVVISWVDVRRYGSASRFTFQAMLQEGTNDIVFQYLNVWPSDFYYGAGRSATVGIENATGTQATKYSYNTASLANYSAIRFTTQ